MYCPYRQNIRSNLALFRQEFALVASLLVDFLGAISLDAPAVACHHVSVPSALVAMFHSLEVLMEPLPMFITNSPGVTGEFIKVTLKEMQLDTYFTPKVAISQQHCSDQNMVVICLLVTKKVSYNFYKR